MMLGGKTWGQQQQGKTQWIKIKRGWRQWSAAKKVFFSLFWLVLPKGPWGPQPLIAISCCVVTHVFISCLALSARKTKNKKQSKFIGKIFRLVFYPFFLFLFLFFFFLLCHLFNMLDFGSVPISMRNRSISGVDLFWNWTWRGKQLKEAKNNNNNIPLTLFGWCAR